MSTHRARGVRSEITTTPEQPKPDQPNWDPPAETPGDLPLTYAEAEARNPFTLLQELHSQALRNDPAERAAPHPHLAELALSAAVIAWWSRWQPLMIHRALLAGASLAEVSAAAGQGEHEIVERWTAWADQQQALLICGRPAVDPAAVAIVRARLAHERRERD
jgi:hypothetical protein